MHVGNFIRNAFSLINQITNNNLRITNDDACGAIISEVRNNWTQVNGNNYFITWAQDMLEQIGSKINQENIPINQRNQFIDGLASLTHSNNSLFFGSGKPNWLKMYAATLIKCLAKLENRSFDGLIRLSNIGEDLLNSQEWNAVAIDPIPSTGESQIYKVRFNFDGTFTVNGFEGLLNPPDILPNRLDQPVAQNPEDYKLPNTPLTSKDLVKLSRHDLNQKLEYQASGGVSIVD